MIQNVNPNRMEMLRLRQRLTLARRGHKLLKDKQEELMRQFMMLIRQTKALRAEVDDELATAQAHFLHAKMDIPPADLQAALLLNDTRVEVDTTYRSIMSLKVPQFTTRVVGAGFTYSFPTTTGDLDQALAAYEALLPRLTELAQQEKTIQLLADDLEKTRRRVNALEHVFIPSLEETIKYIAAKLSEAELATITRLMKIKEMVQAKAAS